MKPEELFENWVRLRARKHYSEKRKQNEYEPDSKDRSTYEEEWLSLYLSDWGQAILISMNKE